MLPVIVLAKYMINNKPLRNGKNNNAKIPKPGVQGPDGDIFSRK